MARTSSPLPDIMPFPEAGALLRRDTRPFTVRYKGLEATVDLPGYYPGGEGESLHVGDDMAGVDGVPSPSTIRRTRTTSRHRPVVTLEAAAL